MKKLTIFTAPKPFVDSHIGRIQRNAIGSWRQMGKEVEILLIGDEVGVADVAREMEVSHIANVDRNDHGTPLISSIFASAESVGSADLFLFVNTDILMLPDTFQLVIGVQNKAKNRLLLGQRYDLDANQVLDFSSGWDQRLRADVKAHGNLHPMGGSDYFIFRRGQFNKIPDFAVGRAGWDNWMIYHAISRGWQVVDATHDLMVIHQNHGYEHLEGDQSHQRHPETMKNLELAGGMRRMYSLLDVEYQLVAGEVRRIPMSLPRFLHKLEKNLQPDELVGRGPRWWLLRGIRKLRRALQGVSKN